MFKHTQGIFMFDTSIIIMSFHIVCIYYYYILEYGMYRCLGTKLRYSNCSSSIIIKQKQQQEYHMKYFENFVVSTLFLLSGKVVPSSSFLSSTSFTTSMTTVSSLLLSSSSRNAVASSEEEEGGSTIPELVVFDLDACLWDQEMYEMTAIPSSTNVIKGDLNGKGKGVIGVMSGRNQISLHKGSLIALQEHWDGTLYPGMKIALASSADTPFAEQVGRATLKLLEVVPGITIWDVLMRDWENVDVNQIGRQPPLSSNKAQTHFPRLKQATNIRYDRMLFFDDCNWGDHCSMVANACKETDTGKGVATQRTPRGLGEREWRNGLQTYATQQSQRYE